VIASINDSMEKIKQFVESNNGKDILVVFIVILVGLGSFGLGRLSKNNSESGIKIEYTNLPANTISSVESAQNAPNITTEKVIPKGSTNSSGKIFFASKIGSKYYSIGCSGGKTLKPENKIYFTTEAEAISAGYEKSSTCK